MYWSGKDPWVSSAKVQSQSCGSPVQLYHQILTHLSTTHTGAFLSLHPHTRFTIKRLDMEGLSISATPNRVLLTGWETMEPSVYIWPLPLRRLWLIPLLHCLLRFSLQSPTPCQSRAVPRPAPWPVPLASLHLPVSPFFLASARIFPVSFPTVFPSPLFHFIFSISTSVSLSFPPTFLSYPS